jgi:diaminohydroxyphosphoribosylaminopyrimidine deaminase/5-amino-6-(5-phosphoribosylamino)uracil reductase
MLVKIKPKIANLLNLDRPSALHKRFSQFLLLLGVTCHTYMDISKNNIQENKSGINGSEEFMRKCLHLAEKAKGFTAPNPMVGAVLVHNRRIIGEGWHHFYGADHAEVNCLKNVSDADKHLIPESTMFVNLEPCAHFGITPPCAHRLVQERVKKVVIANTDPFEKVSGRGITILRDSGTGVITGVCEQEGRWLNRRFFCSHSLKRPYIILKWAQTADGYFAPNDRSRFQITGDESQQLVHKWRTEEAAIMVGTTTALNDNPQLTARLANGHSPLRVILDKDLCVPGTHHIFDNSAASWIINNQKELLTGNIHFIKLAFGDNLISDLMSKLYEARMLSLIVEGGAALLNSFIGLGLWDEARVFTGPQKLTNGIPAPEIVEIEPSIRSQVGDD